jgi:hypothetical protein
VIHVQSRGGQVVATLQQSTVRGIDAGGVDMIGASAAPAERQHILGVRVANSDALAERMTAESYSDLQTVVRLFVPGDEHTEVQIGVVPDDARGTGASLAFHIEPDQVVDVPIEALRNGSYTVTVESDLPVVAAVRQSDVGPEGQTDFAWLAAAEALPAGTDTWIAVTPGPSPKLFLHNPGTTAVAGTLTRQNGTEREVTVDPGSTQVLSVKGRDTFRLQADGELRATVSYRGDRGVAGFPVLPPAAAAEPVLIYPG